MNEFNWGQYYTQEDVTSCDIATVDSRLGCNDYDSEYTLRSETDPVLDTEAHCGRRSSENLYNPEYNDYQYESGDDDDGVPYGEYESGDDDYEDDDEVDDDYEDDGSYNPYESDLDDLPDLEEDDDSDDYYDLDLE